MILLEKVSYSSLQSKSIKNAFYYNALLKFSYQIFLNSSVYGSHGKYNITTLKIPLLVHLCIFLLYNSLAQKTPLENALWSFLLLMLCIWSLDSLLSFAISSFKFYTSHTSRIYKLINWKISLLSDCLHLIVFHCYSDMVTTVMLLIKKFLFCCLFYFCVLR